MSLHPWLHRVLRYLFDKNDKKRYFFCKKHVYSQKIVLILCTCCDRRIILCLLCSFLFLEIFYSLHDDLFHILEKEFFRCQCWSRGGTIWNILVVRRSRNTPYFTSCLRRSKKDNSSYCYQNDQKCTEPFDDFMPPWVDNGYFYDLSLCTNVTFDIFWRFFFEIEIVTKKVTQKIFGLVSCFLIMTMMIIIVTVVVIMVLWSVMWLCHGKRES